MRDRGWEEGAEDTGPRPPRGHPKATHGHTMTVLLPCVHMPFPSKEMEFHWT